MISCTQPVHVIRQSRNGLFRHRWVFTLVGTSLVLDRYHLESRPRKADNFRTVKFYDRGDQERDYGDWKWISAEEVPWDDNLESEALMALTRGIKVAR